MPRTLTLGEDAARAVLALEPLKRTHITGRTGRKLTVVRAGDGSLSAVDFACFHMGGELGLGELVDIEDVGTALQCPAHGYVIDVRTGERLIRHDVGAAAACWKRHGVVQRTHAVAVTSEGVSILLSDGGDDEGGGSLPSDAYNIIAACGGKVMDRPNGGGAAAGIAFACRKSRATQAVARVARAAPTAAPSLSVPAHMAASVPSPVFAAVPSPTTHWPARWPTHPGSAPTTTTTSSRPSPIMRQTTLDSLFGASSPTPIAEPVMDDDGMDTS